MADDSDDDLLLAFHRKRSRALKNASGTIRRRGKEGTPSRDSLHQDSCQAKLKICDQDEEKDVDDDDKPLAFAFPSKRSCKEALETSSNKCLVKMNNQGTTTATTTTTTTVTSSTVTTLEQKRVTLKVYNKKERNSSNSPKHSSRNNGDDDDDMPLIRKSKETKMKRQNFHISAAAGMGMADVDDCVDVDNDGHGGDVDVDFDDDMPLIHMSRNTKKKKPPGLFSGGVKCGKTDGDGGDSNVNNNGHGGDSNGNNNGHGNGVDGDGAHDAGNGDDDMPLIYMPKNIKKQKQSSHASSGSRSGMADAYDDDMTLIHGSNNIKRRKQSSHVSSTKQVKAHVNLPDVIVESQIVANIVAESEEEQEKEVREPKNQHLKPSICSTERKVVQTVEAYSEDEHDGKESKIYIHSSNVNIEPNTVALIAADSEDRDEEEDKETKMHVNSSKVAIERQGIAMVVTKNEQEMEKVKVKEEDPVKDVEEVEKEKVEVAALEEEEESEESEEVEGNGEEESQEEEELEVEKEEQEEDGETEAEAMEEEEATENKLQGSSKREFDIVNSGDDEESGKDECKTPVIRGHANSKRKNHKNIHVVDDYRLSRTNVSFAQSIKLVEEEEEEGGKEEEEEEEDDDNLPLAKTLCINFRKGVSAKANASVVVNAIKDENAINGDEDYSIPLSKQFGIKRKMIASDDAIQKLDQICKKEEDEDEDDNIPLGKMLCLKKRKAKSSKTIASFSVSSKSGSKMDRDEEDDGYNQPLAKNISLKKKQFIAKKLISKINVVDTQEKKSKTPSKWRDSDSDSNEGEGEDENAIQNEKQNENENENYDDEYDVPMVKTIPSVKKNLTAKLKAKSNTRKRKPKIPLKGRNSDDEDDGWVDDEDEDEDDEDEGEDDEDEDYDASVLKKRRIMSKSNTLNSRKHTKRHLKKKEKKMKDTPESGGLQKWTTLEHNGVIFPQPYQSHGIKMLYNGTPVDLTSEQEEVATMFAVMHDTDYAAKDKFVENFWNDWKNLLGENHVIKGFKGCDFTPIYNWHVAEKEKKKQMTTEEKKAAKEEKMKQEEKYMWALVDGVKEKVGNFRVEPPGLFRGRGEHPKMGKVKRRIYPEDIVVNIGADAPIPECPIPGRRWKEIRHDNTVTWLAYWNDPINSKEQKYVFLAASSNLKGQSDKEKYEKARLLKDYIDDIRKTYTSNFNSSNLMTRQIAVATYLIDRLALRAGNEKDDDEADTVGCCSLKVEHVALCPPTSVEFDFLGKDSIRYYNKVEVIEPVYKAIGDFKKDKINGEDLFDKLDTNKLNTHLKNIMPQLTAKVFRTYNASITLDTLLVDTDGQLIPEKIAAYQKANKEVAILCNHQRSVSKTHGAQMEKLEGKLAELTELLDELEKELKMAQKGKPLKKDGDGNSKRNPNPEMLERKIVQTRHKIERMKLDMLIKEDLKTVALGTSKINYMDPRITVAWCKQHEVPIEKIFNKSLLAKFAWAMEADMSFRF